MLCLALCILMLVGIAMPSLDTFARGGKESLLGRLFGVTEALAAPADGATIDESGTYGTCSYDIYSDGTMVIRPTNGTTGTWGPNDHEAPWKWNDTITKNVVGQTAANADDTFTFTIRIKSPTGGDINSASIEIGKLPTAEQSPEPTP